MNIFKRGMRAKGKIQRNNYKDEQRRLPFKFAIANCDCLRFDFGSLWFVAWTNPSVVGGLGTNLRSRGHLVRAREQIFSRKVLNVDRQADTVVRLQVN